MKVERHVTQDAQGNYVNHGPWKMRDERGRLVAQGDYDLGRRTGTWVRWYRDPAESDLFTKLPYEQFLGPFISQATFKDGQLDGWWIIYDNQMRKISQWTFTAGKRHGASIWWYTNGRKMREAQFRDGEMDGYYMEWAPDGTERVKESYQSGRKLAEKITRYPGGKKKSQGMYLFARDVEQSPDDWWNCKLLLTNATGKDEQHGPLTIWHPNGNLAFEGEYDHDVQVGPFTWWHANAQQALSGHYDQGKQQGAWTWWHENGQKSIQGHYVHGTPAGRWVWWQEGGQVAQSADLSNSEGLVIDAPRALDPAAPHEHADLATVGKALRRRSLQFRASARRCRWPMNIYDGTSARSRITTL